MSTERSDDQFAESGRAALAVLAKADGARHASARVAAGLMQAFEDGRTASPADWRRWMAVAAALVLMVGGALGWLAAHRPEPGESRVTSSESRRASDAFVPWPGADTLPAFEGGELVRTRLPASVLPILGLSQADAPADGDVIADVLYGQDGQPRAIRVVQRKLRP